jgi:hypothetical protein
MSLTMQQAVDAMLTLFEAAWDTTGHEAIYVDVPLTTAQEAVIKTGNAPWARVTVKHNVRTQQTLGSQGNRLFDNIGLIIVEVYTPKGDGLTTARSLSTIARDAFEGVSTPNGVWFRNTRVNEIGPEGHWYHTNVIAEFSYDEIR